MNSMNLRYSKLGFLMLGLASFGLTTGAFGTEPIILQGNPQKIENLQTHQSLNEPQKGIRQFSDREDQFQPKELQLNLPLFVGNPKEFGTKKENLQWNREIFGQARGGAGLQVNRRPQQGLNQDKMGQQKISFEGRQNLRQNSLKKGQNNINGPILNRESYQLRKSQQNGDHKFGEGQNEQRKWGQNKNIQPLKENQKGNFNYKFQRTQGQSHLSTSQGSHTHTHAVKVNGDQHTQGDCQKELTPQNNLSKGN